MISVRMEKVGRAAKARGAETSDAVLSWSIVCACALSLILLLTRRLLSHTTPADVYDDALMFTRYAHNILAGYGPAWNPGGPATYGCTSIAYMLASAVGLLAIHNDLALVTILSVGFGLTMLGALGVLVSRVLGGPKVDGAAWLCLLLLPALVLAPPLVMNFVDGMDTTLAVTLFAIWVVGLLRLEAAGLPRTGIGLGIAGALLFWVRPEMAALAAALLAAQWLFGAKEARGRFGIATAACVAAGALVLTVNQAVFHTVVPLAFYAKATNFYGDFNVAFYVPLRGEFLRFFLWLIAGPLAAIGLAAIRERGGFWRRLPLSAKSAAVAGLVYGAYIYFHVLPIMAYFGRFYWPLLPLVFVVAAHAVRPYAGSVHARPAILAGSLSMLAWTTVYFITVVALGQARVPVFDVATNYRTNYGWYWYALDDFSRLPDGVRIATTEVGNPGAMNPGKQVLDLAGLNDTEICRHPHAIVDRMLRFRPDLVYMPHPDYRGMLAEFNASAPFHRDYELFTAANLGAFMSVAIRRDSAFYRQLRVIALGAKGPAHTSPAHG